MSWQFKANSAVIISSEPNGSYMLLVAKQSLSHQSDLATATLNLRQPILVQPWSGFEDGVEGGVSVMDANRTRTTNLFANTKPICITSAQSTTVKALMLVPATRGQR